MSQDIENYFPANPLLWGMSICEAIFISCRTKTQLASEIGGYTERLRKDYEELDTLSIQADMWKSKFMATRSVTAVSLIYNLCKMVTRKIYTYLLVGKLFIDIADIYCFGTGLPISRSKHVFQYRHFK